jgi:hypothetical protein
LPAGVKLGLERKTGLLWLSMRLRPNLLDAVEFDTYLRQFVATALTRKAEVDELLRGGAASARNDNLQALAVSSADSQNLTDAELIVQMRQGVQKWG